MGELPVKQIRRLALSAALVLTAVMGGTYAVRWWRLQQARRAVGAPLEAGVRQQAEKFSFSRTEGGRTLFTIEAARTIERQGQVTLLEDVSVVVHGRSGDRADRIRTARCEYDSSGAGEIFCPEEVQLELGPAAGEGGGPRIRLRAMGVRFEGESGRAWTDQPVEFSFPAGTGRAGGLTYLPDPPVTVLERNVTLNLPRAGEPPLVVRGAELRFYGGERVLELRPPLELKQGSRSLEADSVRLELDPRFRFERMTALGRVVLRGEQDGRRLTGRADRAAAEFGKQGEVERLHASGSTRWQSVGGESQDTLEADAVAIRFAPGQGVVQRVAAEGSALLASQAAEERRELRAPKLELSWGAAGARQLVAPARSRLQITRREGEQRVIDSDRLALDVADGDRLERLAASGQVETQWLRPGAPARSTASDELRAQFDAAGKLSGAEQWGKFRFGDGTWQASAGRAEYNSSSETFFLSEQPAVWDARTRTTARTLELSERDARVRGEGGVRTTERPAAGATAGLGSKEPVQIVSERLLADRRSGWTRYEGGARMWQGEDRLAADAIEIFRQPRRLLATGNVAALFHDTAVPEPGGSGEGAAGNRSLDVRAARLTYTEADLRALFEDDVRAHNDFGRLTARQLEVFLSPGEGSGSGRVERARASGAVRIEQPGRESRSDFAEYAADPQTVALWGGAPQVVDNQRGTTAGARLTLFLGEDRIAIDSEGETRTRTRRPWTR